MALNFPPSPIIGQSYTVGSKTYTWSGAAWLVTAVSQTFNSLTISTSTNATSTNSGAVQVVGGMGIGGDLWLGGTLYSNSQPVITTATLSASIFGGNDITITSTGTTATSFLRFDNTSTLQTVTNRGFTTTNRINVTNSTESTTTNTGALVVAGGIGVGKRVNCESLRIADSIFDSTEVTVATTASVVIDSFLSTDFRSAKYFIQISSAGTAFSAVEINLIHYSNTVYSTQYGLVNTGGSLGSFTADLSIVDSIVRLYFTASAATNKTIKVLRTGMAS
jgi:hypothetical protein